MLVQGNDVSFSQHGSGISVAGGSNKADQIVVRGKRINTTSDNEKDCIYINNAIHSTMADNVTFGGRRAVGTVRNNLTSVTVITVHKISATVTFLRTITFHIESNCKDVVLANHVDPSNGVHGSFLYLSSNGKTVNNVSLR